MSKVYRTIFSRYAEDDLNEIVDYYIPINTKYAAKLIEQFEKRILELKRYPGRGRIVPELETQNIVDYRELIEANYRIIFAIQEDTVIILTIIDARRNVEEVIIKKLMRYYE